MKKKHFKHFVLGTVTLLFVITLSMFLFAKKDIQKTIIAEAQATTTLTDNNEEPCVPVLQMFENDGNDLILVAESETTLSNDEPATYRMWYHDDGTRSVITPIELEQFEICGLAYTKAESINNVPLTTRIPLPIARDLTLKFYQKIAATQGEEAYRQRIEDSFANPQEPLHAYDGDDPESYKPILTSVQMWVYEQMGVDISEDSYRLEDIDNEYAGPGLGGD